MAIVLNVSGTRVYMAPEYFRFGWYDGCQATVWALGMILVDMLSPYMAFSKPEQAYGKPPRIPHHLSPGNLVTLSTALFRNMRTLKFKSRLHNCVFRCRQSKLRSQATNLETQKHTKRIEIHQSQITNLDLLNPLK